MMAYLWVALGSALWNGWGRDLDNTRYQPEPAIRASDVAKLALKFAYGYQRGTEFGQPTVVDGRVFVTGNAGRIYSLDSNRQKIKQVGHADVTSTVADNGDATLTSASDSPSQFSLTITRQDQVTTGQLANAVLFTGEVASNVALKCRAK